MTLTLDTSVLWDEYCLIEVCLVWGGRSIPLGQTVLSQGSATVGFEDYCPVLETTLRLLPLGCRVTLLADRGFEHGALIRWLQDHKWSWAIRAKSNLSITYSNGKTAAVASLEKCGKFLQFKDLIRVYNGKRGLHLVVVYLVVGQWRVPWSFRVWRGKVLLLLHSWD